MSGRNQMTRARKEFLIWWWTMVTLYTVLSTVGMYIEWDEINGARRIATMFAILVLVWIPGALLGRARSPR